MNKKHFIRWVKDFKIFVVMVIVGVITLSWVAWDLRPAQMRNARYTNTIDYATVEGSYDFESIYDYFENAGAKVSKSLFKLQKPYVYTSNQIDMVIDGYELVELERPIRLGDSTRTANTNRYLIASITISNGTESSVVVKDFRNVAFEKDYLSTSKADASFTGFDWASTGSTGGEVTIAAGKEKQGVLFIGLDANGYANLFMEGSIKLETPEIRTEDDMANDWLFSAYRQIDLPVAESEVEKIYDTVDALPTNMLRSAQGHGVATERYEPDVTFFSDDKTLSATIERIDFVNGEYKPSYLETHRYSEKGIQRSMVYRVRYENHGSKPIQVSDLQTSLESANAGRKRSNYPMYSRNFINPNEPREVIYEFEERSNSVVKMSLGDQLEFSVVSENNRTLLTGTFTLEK